MPAQPEIALLVSSFERPDHLRRALVSIALQQGATRNIEVVITDDGSADETPQMVRDFAATVDFPVRFVTHPHNGFQLARCRNEGVRASTAPYLLFLDGDCLLPPDHLAIHLARREPGVAIAGDCARLDRALSEQIDEAAIRNGAFARMMAACRFRQVRRRAFRNLLYQWLRHPSKPRLVGNNVAVWRADYQRVNGYDENFVGWGGEDDDMGQRLRRAGVRIKSIQHQTYTYHLWHPAHETRADKPNLAYLERRGVPARCVNGLMKDQTRAA
jgi:glycosyltransferase involved in cell wall biosynthesis